jgi:glucose 1-dehydrogenase
MRALTVVPEHAGSLDVTEVPEVEPRDGELLVDGLAVGVCGTDREIAAGDYGWAPPGHDRLILGHESLGRVRSAPEGSDFSPGDLVVGVVRRPDPVPCPPCGRDEFDMCRNGRYTERGIKELDGYGSEEWTVETDYAVRLEPRLDRAGVLMEPASVVAKAWDHLERIGHRSWFAPSRVLVTGAGPIGLLAALMGVQRGLDVHVLARTREGPKPELVAALGATYHGGGDLSAAVADGEPDVVVECTGAGPLVFDLLLHTAPGAVVCLTGISAIGRTVRIDPGQINRELVLENAAVFGSVNANLRHFQVAAEALAAADTGWLERLITRRVPLDRAVEAFTPEKDDVKAVVDLSG